MSLSAPLATVVALDQKQRFRILFEDGSTIDGRVSQTEYDVEERVRLEFEPRNSDGRYQLRSDFADGEWGPVTVRAARPTDGVDSRARWNAVGTVREVTPLERSQYGDRVDDAGW